MDDLHRHLFTVLMDREWKHGVAAAVDVTLLGRFYERFADHAVEVARRVIFQATGKLPDEEEHPSPALSRRPSRPQHDLSPGVPLLQRAVRLFDLVKRVNLGHRHLQLAVGDQARQLGQHRRRWRRRRCPRT